MKSKSNTPLPLVIKHPLYWTKHYLGRRRLNISARPRTSRSFLKNRTQKGPLLSAFRAEFIKKKLLYVNIAHFFQLVELPALKNQSKPIAGNLLARIQECYVRASFAGYPR